MIAALLLATSVLATPAQDVQGRRFVLDGAGVVQFEVPTSVGIVRGEIPIEKLETRGIEGWGRFDVRLFLDADRVRTGDKVRDAFIAQTVLHANDGPLFLASTERKSPAFRAGQGQKPEDEMWSFGAWLDPRRGRGYLPLHYRFTLDETNNRGRLEITKQATLKELGLEAIPHPFVTITGPVTLRLAVDLTRS